MRCHYTYDKKAGKVLIPGCMGAAVYGERACTCKNQITTFAQFEKQEYNRILNEKNELINDLESEVFRLNRILKKLLQTNNHV